MHFTIEKIKNKINFALQGITVPCSCIFLLKFLWFHIRFLLHMINNFPFIYNIQINWLFHIYLPHTNKLTISHTFSHSNYKKCIHFTVQIITDSHAFSVTIRNPICFKKQWKLPKNSIDGSWNILIDCKQTTSPVWVRANNEFFFFATEISRLCKQKQTSTESLKHCSNWWNNYLTKIQTCAGN